MADGFPPSLGERIGTVSRFAAELTDEPAGRRYLARQAVLLGGCVAAAVATPARGGKVDLVFGGEDAAVKEVAAAVQDSGEAAALRAIAECQPVISLDLGTEERWRRYADGLRTRSNIRAVQACPVHLDGTILGAVVRYAATADSLDEAGLHFGLVFADQIALPLSILASRTKVEQLERGLASSREIGAAMGILMAFHKITQDQAFNMLRTTSQNQHVKLREVAREVLVTGQLQSVDGTAVLDGHS